MPEAKYYYANWEQSSLINTNSTYISLKAYMEPYACEAIRTLDLLQVS